MKSSFGSTLSIVFMALLTVTCPRAEAWDTTHQMTRGVYADGQVYYFSLGTDSGAKVTVYPGSVTPDDMNGFHNFRWSCKDSDKKTKDVGACAYTHSKSNAISVGSRLWFAYTGWKDCKASNGTSTWVIAYDRSSESFDAPSLVTPKLHHANNGDKNGDTTAVSIAFFDGLFYVFDDVGVHTSADGTSWVDYPGYPLTLRAGNTTSDPDMQPLDAVNYSPPGGTPRLLVVYGKLTNRTIDTPIYDSLYAVSWDGKTDGTGEAPTEDDLTSRVVAAASTRYGESHVHAAALLPGTAYQKNGSTVAYAGAKAPSVQLFVLYRYQYTGVEWNPAVLHLAYSYGENGTNDWSQKTDWAVGGSSSDAPHIYPWYTTECGEDASLVRQHLVSDDSPKYFHYPYAYTSDLLVPGYLHDRETSTCEDQLGEGTATSASANIDVLRKHWSLVGLVLGPPPFALNGKEPLERKGLSNVEFAQTTSTDTDITSTSEDAFLASAKGKVQWGLKGAKHGEAGKSSMGFAFDHSFKYAWEHTYGSSTTYSKEFSATMGTEFESKEEDGELLGGHGWAIFHAPVMYSQYYDLYAYDRAYDSAGNLAAAGSALDQGYHSVRSGKGSNQLVSFRLTDPGCESGDCPEIPFKGLMKGLAPLPASTDIEAWGELPAWEVEKPAANAPATPPWYTLLGSGASSDSIDQVQFSAGVSTGMKFAEETTSFDATGTSWDIEVKAGFSMEKELGLGGWKSPKTELEVLAGYEGSFSTETRTTQGFSQDVQAKLGMDDCRDADCYNALFTQPYLLRTNSDAAPWLPEGYKSQRPWAIHWKVTYWSRVDGTTSGDSPAPEEASGQVVGGNGGRATAAGSTAAANQSGYSLRGGSLAWKLPDGTVRPIPMTAAQFDPGKGVTLKLNGHTWSSARSDGRWTRSGKVWTFATKTKVTRDRVTLVLDFGAGTWDLDLSRVAFPFLMASESRARMKLVVNEKYGFLFTSDHDIRSDWDLLLAPGAADTYHLERYRGWYDSSTGKGVVRLEGTLPDDLSRLGDVSFGVNGQWKHVPLRLHEEFQWARAFGKKLVYEKDGIRVAVDFGRKRWSARFRGDDAHPLHAPQFGASKVTVAVGGVPVYSARHAITDFTTRLQARSGKPGARGGTCAALAGDGPVADEPGFEEQED